MANLPRIRLPGPHRRSVSVSDGESVNFDIPIHEQVLDELDARSRQGVKTERIVLPFQAWEQLVKMIGGATAIVKLEYGKMTWLTKYGEVVCVPGEAVAARYEP